MPEPRRDPDQRPSPEALLEAAQREEAKCGRLKIFVGAAPGVGKTYEMLLAARARLKEGADVVAAVVETHGRVETETLLDGIEIIPRKKLEYKGRTLEEMDLDAVISRQPDIALVDELAHTNVPGSRHPKRYLDIEELINHGITVYTTVNIQHIESLNDVVAQITRIRVRETVPDSILDRADDIELVDLTPEDLIKRLEEGKVYVPKQARRALQHYFSPGNLTALRELALRRTADRVDDQLLSHMQAHAIPGPWPAGDRLLVCVSEDPRSAGLVRLAKRLADRLHAPLTAISIETRRSLQLSEEDRDRIADTLRLAERLGAEAITLPTSRRRIADDILAYAQSNNITHILVGKSARSRWFEIVNGSVVHDLVRRAGNISIHVVAGDEIDGDPIPKKTVRAAPDPSSHDMLAFPAAIAAVAAAVGVGSLIKPTFGIENVDLVFLTATVAIAIRFGLLPSLVTSALSALAYNFFFLPPLYTLSIGDPTHIAAFAFFALVAVLVSNLAARARAHALAAFARVRTTESLYAFSRKLAGAGTLDDVLWASGYQIASMLKVRVVLLLPEGSTLSLRSGYPPEDALDASDLAAADWAWSHNRPAGRGADTLPGAKRLFLPMRTGRGTIGVVGIDSDKPGPLLTREQRRLLDALIDQAALAIERVHLVEEADRVKRSIETDKLRAAILTSLSHDLRTPLSSIMGAAGALRDLSDALSKDDKTDLLDTIVEEAERLNRFIANLLHMTKLEAGAVTPDTAPHVVSELIATTLTRAAKIIDNHKVELDLAADLPMVNVDGILFEQAMFNLIDNASKYAPAGTTIRIQGWREGDLVRLQVLDEGPGIPPEATERVFDRFYRVHKEDSVRAGTGLGLAVSRGFIEAMQGRIVAGNRSDRSGAVFTVTLPVAETTRELEPVA
jgi:two-component system, OmpR family, sensor histidine kinase KdpD